MPGPPVTVVGNTTDRRVTGFAAAARAAGHAVATLSWSAVADGARPGPGPVRLDSPGDDRVLDARLRGDTVAAPGELRSTRAWHAGLTALLDLTRTFPGPLLNDPDDVAVLFDKHATAARLRAGGVAVPDADDAAPQDLGAVEGAARRLGTRRVFLKPRCGSSGAGVVALSLGPHPVAVGNVEIGGDGRLFCSLRSRRLTGTVAVADLVDRLCALDEVRVERWYPKAGLDGRVVDLRVLVVAGRPGHVVARTATGPITNLNLGGGRGDADALRDACGPRWADVVETCARVGALFPGSLHVGVDVLVGVGFAHHVVGEVNAFGDLLPRVLHQGRSTFAAEVDALPAFLARTGAAA